MSKKRKKQTRRPAGGGQGSPEGEVEGLLDSRDARDPRIRAAYREVLGGRVGRRGRKERTGRPPGGGQGSPAGALDRLLDPRAAQDPDIRAGYQKVLDGVPGAEEALASILRHAGPASSAGPVKPRHHRAVDVPRLRRRLLEHCRSAALANILDHHPEGKTHWPMADPFTRWPARRWQGWLADRLAEAELFYVTEEMTDVVVLAAAKKPAYEVFADRLPARVGFVVYGKPMAGTDLGHVLPGQRVEVSAALWAPVDDLDGYGTSGLMMVAFQDTRVMYGSQLLGRELLLQAVEVVGPLTYHEEYPLPYGNAEQRMDEERVLARLHNREPDPAVGRVGNEGVAGLMVTWMLMGQRIAEVGPPALPRKLARKADRGEAVPEREVRVVDLRQRRRPADRPRGEEGAEPAWRVGVRTVVSDYSYWRNTWYPSEGRHRQQFVNVPAYVRGPEGAPFVEKVKRLSH